jgi:hypothetical protein
MIGKHPLAVHKKISVIESCAQEQKDCQAQAQPTRTGREISLDRSKNGCKQRHRSEDDKVHESKEVKMGWHAAPGFRPPRRMGLGWGLAAL